MQSQEATVAEKTQQQQQLFLPHELIIQILLWLPVKSLLRFRSVCKSWFSVISDTHFANSHFQLSTATSTNRRVLLLTPSPFFEIQSVDFEQSFYSDSASTSLNPDFNNSESSLLEIKGSCRGFILLHGRHNVFVWNPSTGLHKKLPLPRYATSLYLCDSNRFYGFGYDYSTDDYLLVSLSHELKLSQDFILINVTKHLEVFSLRANTWKEIEGNFPYIDASNKYPKKVGSFFNGAIHWYAFRDDIRENIILAFDLMERKLFEMCLPDDVDYESKNCDLWVYGEFLSLWALDVVDRTIEIWAMKEYKVHSSWTKILVLTIDGNPIINDCFSLTCSTKSGDIIGTYDGTRVVKYNDKGALLEYLSNFDNPHESQGFMYTESLLSLPGDSEQA